MILVRRDNLEFAAMTHKGMVRMRNEDNFRAITKLEGVPQIFVIADGMGGHNAGDVASVVAVDSVSAYLSNPEIWINGGNNTFDFIVDAMDMANKQVVSIAKADGDMAGMGTTMIISILIDNKLYIGHVGDSRLYLIRDSHIKQITSDHSLVEALVKEGSISKEDAKNHPSKNIITRVIGTNENANADTIAVDINPGDVFLMCTDGLTNKLEDYEIDNIIVEFENLNDACTKLVELANNRGGEDNVTVILISLRGK